jgi:predicted ArsR family transcriptional regulator
MRRGGWRKPAHRQELAIATVQAFGHASTADIARQLGITHQAARCLVEKLIDKGVLDREWWNGKQVIRSLRVAV